MDESPVDILELSDVEVREVLLLILETLSIKVVKVTHHLSSKKEPLSYLAFRYTSVIL